MIRPFSRLKTRPKTSPETSRKAHTENSPAAGDAPGAGMHVSIRKRIETLGSSLSLPTVRKALGALEGEHSSGRRAGSADVMDIRAYEYGDEAHRIDWKTSARVGRPMIAQRERLAASKVWMLFDVGVEMTGICDSGEHAYDVAANALCMFAALSLRRSDPVSLVFGDECSITRVPFHGGLAQFERTLDNALHREWSNRRNIDALLNYATHIRDRDALVVIATDEHALSARHTKALRRIMQTHPVILIDVTTINPFVSRHNGVVLDGMSPRAVPAFLRDREAVREVDTHRHFIAATLEREMTRMGAHVIRAGSSEAMFNAFVRLVSTSLSYSMRNHLKTATMPANMGTNMGANA